MNPPIPIATVRMYREQASFYAEGGITFERAVRGIGWLATDDPSQLMVDYAKRLKPHFLSGRVLHDEMIELLGSLLHQLGTDSDLGEIAGAAKYDRLEEQVRDVLELLDPTHPALRQVLPASS